MSAAWVIVGGGLTGASLAYELTKRGQSVLLVERDRLLQGATRWSYGGIAYWAGTTPVTRQICQESHDRYRVLMTELEGDLEYRETQLLITIGADQDPALVCQDYQKFGIPPEMLSPAETQAAEPLLNIGSLSGSLRFPHAHINPLALAQSYTHAFQRLGGQVVYATVTALLSHPQQKRVIGLHTTEGTIEGDRVIICAGGLGRSLLTALGIQTPLYFTQAELIETHPTDLRLEGVVLPAAQSRLRLEAKVTDSAFVQAWEAEDFTELAPPALEPGCVQFQDGHLCLGQISRLYPTPRPPVNAGESEALIRGAIRQILPELSSLPGVWHQCVVSFSADGFPLIGALKPLQNLDLFSGFTSPFALVPALADRFAESLVGQADPLLADFAPDRGSLATRMPQEPPKD
jgi:glycine/D-amino acid oxidase-like deaminating enzyme